MDFQIRALPRAPFEPLLRLSDEALVQHRARRERVTAKPGTPCRVSLQDAEPGEEVLLLHYVHQPAESPFHASHAIYVRMSAVEAKPSPNEVPDFLRGRLLSLRAFDRDGLMLDADVSDGTDVESLIDRLFQRPEVSYIHIHNARQGCYLACVDRQRAV